MAGYDAAIAGAAFIVRDDLGLVEFAGAQAEATLNGLVTNDVAAMRDGEAMAAAALTAKGKVIATMQLVRAGGTWFAVVDSAAMPGLLAMLRKFVNPRFATARDVSADRAIITVVGPRSQELAPAVPGAVIAASSALVPPSSLVVVARGAVDDAGRQLAGAGAAPLAFDELECLRVEGGWPRWGLDVDESHLAQEAGLDRADAISFNKGCYTGQETVARVHFRGHVNRTLRGLRAEQPVESGMSIVRDEAVVGDVRSVAMSPRFGAIALAYVRREVEDGASVAVRGDGRDVRATVVALPLG